MPIRIQLLMVLFCVCAASLAYAQEEVQIDSKSQTETKAPPTTDMKAEKVPATEQVKETVGKLTKMTEEEAKKIAKKVDEDPRAKKAAAGILEPIYTVAEALAFPAFHWVAFALMASGVFSFALQLVLGKLVVLTRLGFSLKEIASDAVGLAISVFGLVLTTQAAVENSDFTQSPTAVISATVVGAIVGIVLYFWGQSQELQAAAGRSKAAVATGTPKSHI